MTQETPTRGRARWSANVKTLGDAKPKVGGNGKPRIGDLVPLAKLVSGFTTYRLVGPIFSIGMHWIEINKKDGTKVSLGKPCIAWDMSSESVDSTKKCPWCELAGRPKADYYQNAIDRDMQENQPNKLPPLTKTEIETGFKASLDSKAWTPVEVLRLPATMVDKIQKMTALNKHKVDGTTEYFSVADDDFGCDLSLSYDKNKKGTDAYNAQMGRSNELSDEEFELLLWNLEKLDIYDTEEEADVEAKRMVTRMTQPPASGPYAVAKKENYEDDNDEGYTRQPARQSNRPQRGTGGRGSAEGGEYESAPAPRGRARPSDPDLDGGSEQGEDIRSTRSNPPRGKLGEQGIDEGLPVDEFKEEAAPAPRGRRGASAPAKVEAPVDVDDFAEEEAAPAAAPAPRGRRGPAPVQEAKAAPRTASFDDFEDDIPF